MPENSTIAQEVPPTSDARKANFARHRPGGITRDRASMSVRVAIRADGSRPAAPTPDPAAIAESQRRFAICKACDHSRDDGFTCDLYHDCCFGRFRSAPANHCPQELW